MQVPEGAWDSAVCGAGEEASLPSSRHTAQLLETDSRGTGAGRGGRMLVNTEHTFSEPPGLQREAAVALALVRFTI